MALQNLKTLTGPAALRLLGDSADPELLTEQAGTPARVLVHEGDLSVPGDLTLPVSKDAPRVLVVKGDLSVGGLFMDSGEPPTAVLVKGGLRADVLLCSGTLEVGGDLKARIVLGGDSDNTCRVNGTLQADLFYSDEHFFEAERARIGKAVGNSYRLEIERGREVDFVDGDDRDILGILVEEVLVVDRDSDGDIVDLRIDHGAFVRRVLAGEPVLRS
ncbi:MAG: hypothetical protein RBU30_06755 [Polyangia bacterium]|jgi:hypothetical protein|nr:hypothetical protein [Polyangia bacterium]